MYELNYKIHTKKDMKIVGEIFSFGYYGKLQCNFLSKSEIYKELKHWRKSENTNYFAHENRISFEMKNDIEHLSLDDDLVFSYKNIPFLLLSFNDKKRECEEAYFVRDNRKDVLVLDRGYDLTLIKE